MPELNYKQLFLLLELMPLPTFVLQGDHFKLVNHLMTELTGYSREELLQHPVQQILYPAEQKLWTKYTAGANLPESLELKIVTAAGKVLYLQGYFRSLALEEGPAILGQLTNVTAMRKLMKELRRAEARLRDIFENVNDIIYLHDPEGRFLTLNPALTRLTGFLPQELVGKSIADFLHPQVRHQFASYLKEIKEKGETRGIMHAITKEGKEIFWEYQSVLFRGKKSFVRGIARDVTEQVKMRRELQNYLKLLMRKNQELIELTQELTAAKKQLEKMARTDPLTGLGNRFAFQEAITREINCAQRYHTPLSLLVIDVTNFKTINDTLGHPSGDQALVRIAELLQENCRACDLIFRIGGDEFAVLMPHTGKAEAQAAARRIFQNINCTAIVEGITEPITILGVELPVCLSIGIATFDPGQEKLSAEELLKQADALMYQEKRRQKSQLRKEKPPV